MRSPLNPGAIVVLKSGGPAMTIDNLNTTASGNLYTCYWRTRDSTQTADFFEEELVLLQDTNS
jgi:uncharacterized protein YodC (DUF2158 family)